MSKGQVLQPQQTPPVFSVLQRRASPPHGRHSTSRLLIQTDRQTPNTGTELSMLGPRTPQQPLPRSLSPQARERAAHQSDLSFLGQQL